MAPKTKYTLDDIINAAFDLVRQTGIDKLTARGIAEKLNASTMPIYSCGKSMLELEEEVLKKAWALLYDYQNKKRSGDSYLDLGLGYVMFAREEYHLYKSLHSDDHKDFNKGFAEENFLKNFERMSEYHYFKEITDEAMIKIMTQGWIYTHGFTELITSSRSDAFDGIDTEEQITTYFLEVNLMYWAGLEHYIKQNKK